MANAPKTKPRSYRGISMDERRDQRRRQVMQAALTVFAASGFHGATVRLICREAGLTERYLYEAFDNLDELFDAVWEEEAQKLEALLAEAGARTADPSRRLRAVLTAYFSHFSANRQVAQVLLIEGYSASKNMEGTVRRGIYSFTGMVRSVLPVLDELPRKSGLSAELLATALVGAISQLAMRWHMEGYRTARADIIKSAMVILLGVADRLEANLSV